MKSYFVCVNYTLNSIFNNNGGQINAEQKNAELRLSILHISSHNSFMQSFISHFCVFLSFEILKTCLNLNQTLN